MGPCGYLACCLECAPGRLRRLELGPSTEASVEYEYDYDGGGDDGGDGGCVDGDDDCDDRGDGYACYDYDGVSLSVSQSVSVCCCEAFAPHFQLGELSEDVAKFCRIWAKPGPSRDTCGPVSPGVARSRPSLASRSRGSATVVRC